ncbi:major capsid protein [Actinobacillus equuli]|uniref:major capsid protein n=1 Tax=Actinobacillus equuli TaxID=718 RepID=UPI0024413821|nr:major capsid protein [Actinobacillus equuli]WGE52382.1 major capsid protein [Actinobacillus equuli subsp. haemolyticus]
MSGQKVHTRLTDPVLTEYALGYHNNEFVGEALLPVAEIPKEGARLPKFGKDAFVTEKDERELHAASNKITPAKFTQEEIALTEKDLAYPIDYRENQEADLDYEQFAMDLVMEKMALNRELRIKALVTNEAAYGAKNKITLSGTSQFSHADSKLFKVFDDAFEAVRMASGKSVNRIIISSNVWTAIRNHKEVLDILKQRGLKSLSPALFADLIKGENQEDLQIFIGRASYTTQLDQDTQPVWQNDIVMAYVPPKGADGKHKMYKPSFGYVYRRKGSFVVDKYDSEGNKVYNVRATDINKEYLLMTESGYLIKSAV